MKIRTGHVSNSSTSTFILCFPNEMKTVEELKEALFPDRSDPLVERLAEQIAYRVWDSIENQTPMTKEEIAEVCLRNPGNWRGQIESIAVGYRFENDNEFGLDSIGEMLVDGYAFGNVPFVINLGRL